MNKNKIKKVGKKIMKHEELISNKTMDNRTLFLLWDAQQAISAKHADNAIDRAKRNFTNREKCDIIGAHIYYTRTRMTIQSPFVS